MFRLDNSGAIKSWRETPEGFLDLYLTFSKVGTLEYCRVDGTIETEHVTAESLFNEESLATATGKPITYLHPPERVTAHNFWKFARGTTGTKVIKDEPFVTIVGTVHDAGLIDIIKSGKARQVSAGYNVEVVKKADGKLYQQNRVYNHFSVVPEGRAGESVRVHYYDSPDTDVNIDVRSDRLIMNPIRYDSPFSHLRRENADDVGYIPKWQRPLRLSTQIPQEEVAGLPRHERPLALSKNNLRSRRRR